MYYGKMESVIYAVRCRVELTSHAKKRWKERCQGLDPDNEWGGAKRVGRARRKKIMAACQKHAELMRGGFKGVYYTISRNEVVFVVVPPEKVITVFRYQRLLQPIAEVGHEPYTNQ